MKSIMLLAGLVIGVTAFAAEISVALSGKSSDPIIHASLRLRDALQIEPLVRSMQIGEPTAGCAVEPQPHAGVFDARSIDESMAVNYRGRLPWLSSEVGPGGAIRPIRDAILDADREAWAFGSEPRSDEHFSAAHEPEWSGQNPDSIGSAARQRTGRVRF